MLSVTAAGARWVPAELWQYSSNSGFGYRAVPFPLFFRMPGAAGIPPAAAQPVCAL